MASLLALTLSAQARSLSIVPSPNINRNAGQTIPLTFNASGWAVGQTVEIRLVNARTWGPGEVIEPHAPVVNGVNNLQVTIPWSWQATGPFVIKLVIWTTAVTDTRIVNIRSAVIWPYAGTVFPAGGMASLVWVVGNWDLGNFVDFLLVNEDTGEGYALNSLCDDPYSGRFTVDLPDGVTGPHFRIRLNAFYAWEVLCVPNDPDCQEGFIEVVESTRSAVIAIR